MGFAPYGRGGEIGTDDPLTPSQVRYQAALNADAGAKLYKLIESAALSQTVVEVQPVRVHGSPLPAASSGRRPLPGGSRRGAGEVSASVDVVSGVVGVELAGRGAYPVTFDAVCFLQGDRVVHGDEGRRSEEHTSELQSRGHLVCRLLLEKKTTL